MVLKYQQFWFVMALFCGKMNCFENWLDITKAIKQEVERTNYTKVYFSVVKLKLGVTLRMITSGHSFVNNFQCFMQLLKIRTSWRRNIDLYCWHNPHDLQFFKYTNVPTYFMEDTGNWENRAYYKNIDEQIKDLVNFEPCKHSIQRCDHDQEIKHIFFSKICHPTNAQILPQDRQGFHITLTENNLFQINLTFTVFQYDSHSWCFTDFLYIKHCTRSSTKNEKPRYVFCGKKHPWTILYTSNAVSLFTVAKLSSRFVLYYQVLDKGYFHHFHVCHYIQCHRSFACVDQLTPSISYRTTHILSHKILNTVDYIFIINIMINKTLILQLSSSAFVAVYDGPTIESIQHSVSHDKWITLSAFQATVQTQVINWLTNTKNNVISYKSQKHSNCFKAQSPPHNVELHFHALCDISPCVQYHRYCIEQPLGYSYNITVDSVIYFGPEEPVYINKAGGVAVYFVDACDAEEEVLDISHNVSRHTTDQNRGKQNQFILISKASTVSVVLVYYYFSLYCFASAKISLSKSECVGHHVSIKFCNKEHIFLYAKKHMTQCPQLNNIHLRNDCLLVTIDNDRKNVPMFKHFLKRRYNSKKQWVYLHIQTRVLGLTELEIETYHFQHRVHLYGQHFMLADMHEGNSSGVLAVTSHRFLDFTHNYKQIRKCCHLSNKISCPEVDEIKHTVHVTSTTQTKFHQTVKFIAEAMRNYFVFYTNRDDILHSWAVVTVKKLTCTVLLNGTLLLPTFLVESVLKTNCKLTLARQFEVDLDINQFLRRNGYKLVLFSSESPISSGFGQWHPENGSKLVFMNDAMKLNLPFDRQSNRVYLQSNISKTGTVSYFLSNSVPVFKSKWPAKVLDVYVPILTLPKCYQSSNMFKCYFKFMISQDLLSEAANFQVYVPEKQPEAKNIHLILHQQCRTETCAKNFFSWNDANIQCKSKGMHLPSIHSTNDQSIIKFQTERHGCYQSWHNISSSADNLVSEIEFLYETVGIYIGFQVMVSMLRIPYHT